MGDPTYDSIRAAEKRDKLAAEVGMAALEALGAFFKGKATLSIMPNLTQGVGTSVAARPGWNIRFIRDAEAPK